MHMERLGTYIEQVYRTNADLRYGLDDVRGVSNTKEMMQSRANLIGRTFEKFLVISPGDFVFNRRTTRNGEKIGMAFNNTDRDYIFTEDYVAFKVKDDYKAVLLPEYLYLFFRRSEFDRYARMFWMDKSGVEADTPFDNEYDALYPYLTWATYHFNGDEIPNKLIKIKYPMSWEIKASEAKYDLISPLSEEYAKEKCSAPHSWHAAEMFMYLIEKELK